MSKILFCWIGLADLKASKEDDDLAFGPIAHAMRSYSFDRLVLISNWTKKEDEAYVNWLSRLSKAKITHHKAKLTSPTHYGDIYENVVKTVAKYKKETAPDDFFFPFKPWYASYECGLGSYFTDKISCQVG